MKKIKHLFFLTGMLLAAALPAQAKTQVIDRVIAIVDQDVVLASELATRLDQISRKAAAAGKSLPPQNELYREILDRLILDSLQLQMAERAGVRISDAQLNAAVGRIAAQNQLSLAQFREKLEAEGESYEQTREEIRRELLIQRVQQGQVSQRIQITEQEIEGFLNSEEGQELVAPRYRLMHVLLSTPSNASSNDIERAQQKAQQLSAKAKKIGLATAANALQLTPLLSDLGWRGVKDLPGLFTEIAPQLKKGDVADPIRSSSGFHVIQLVDVRGDDQWSNQTLARHILAKSSAIRTEEETKAFIESLRQRALQGEDFALLAKQHSEDIGSAQEGGELGWTNPGQFVPEFEGILNETGVGEISQTFKSRYGWHVLQVIDRRNKNVTEELQRRRIADFIHQRKFNDELQAWLQKIRDEAFVDIKAMQ